MPLKCFYVEKNSTQPSFFSLSSSVTFKMAYPFWQNQCTEQLGHLWRAMRLLAAFPGFPGDKIGMAWMLLQNASVVMLKEPHSHPNGGCMGCLLAAQDEAFANFFSFVKELTDDEELLISLRGVVATSQEPFRGGA